jgi:hypothetical protein
VQRISFDAAVAMIVPTLEPMRCSAQDLYYGTPTLAVLAISFKFKEVVDPLF